MCSARNTPERVGRASRSIRALLVAGSRVVRSRLSGRRSSAVIRLTANGARAANLGEVKELFCGKQTAQRGRLQP